MTGGSVGGSGPWGRLFPQDKVHRDAERQHLIQQRSSQCSMAWLPWGDMAPSRARVEIWKHKPLSSRTTSGPPGLTGWDSQTLAEVRGRGDTPVIFNESPLKETSCLSIMGCLGCLSDCSCCPFLAAEDWLLASSAVHTGLKPVQPAFHWRTTEPLPVHAATTRGHGAARRSLTHPGRAPWSHRCNPGTNHTNYIFITVFLKKLQVFHVKKESLRFPGIKKFLRTKSILLFLLK